MRSAPSQTMAVAKNAVPIAGLPQGKNGVSEFIPVARVSDMLLNPGDTVRTITART